MEKEREEKKGKKCKFYAVAKGRQVGIFYTWNETEALVTNFKGATFKSFETLEFAQT